MRLVQVRRHEVGVVEVSQSCVWMGGAGVEYGLCERRYSFRQINMPFLKTRRRREGIVNDD